MEKLLSTSSEGVNTSGGGKGDWTGKFRGGEKGDSGSSKEGMVQKEGRPLWEETGGRNDARGKGQNPGKLH